MQWSPSGWWPEAQRFQPLLSHTQSWRRTAHRLLPSSTPTPTSQPGDAAIAGTQREITFRFLAEPNDVNFGGNVHGGAVMKWIDQAGYACAAGWAGTYCVTVYVGGIQFERPIRIGQLVEVHAQVVHTGTTSMHVAVTVAARDTTAEGAERTTHCLMVFVAQDAQRNAVPVPAFEPVTAEERELSAYAQNIMRMRKAIEAERRSFLARSGG